MKKAILLFGMLASCSIFGQFKLTPDNYRSVENPDKDYIVFEVPNMTQKQLFEKTKMYITSKYNNLKGDGYNEVEPQQMVLNVTGSKSATVILSLGNNIWRVDNRYEINFKDGKLMVKPYLYSFYNVMDNDSSRGVKYLYNKKGEARKQKAIDLAESEVNEFYNALIKGISKTNEDW